MLTKTSRAVGDLVIIEILKQRKKRLLFDGVYIPLQYTENNKLVRGKVLSVGPKAQSENINVGDEVLYDKHSIYSQFGGKGTEKEGDIVITKVENVIGLYEGDEKEYED
jgi:co-chaperonin GroES (HSP10)